MIPELLQLHCNIVILHQVYNIQNMTVNNVMFKETQDHSKWAVTDEEQAIVCIGGINRQVCRIISIIVTLLYQMLSMCLYNRQICRMIFIIVTTHCQTLFMCLYNLLLFVIFLLSFLLLYLFPC